MSLLRSSDLASHCLIWLNIYIDFIFCHFQSFAVNEPHRLTTGSSRKWEAWVSHAQFLWAVSQNLHRWPGAKIIKGNCGYVVICERELQAVVCLDSKSKTNKKIASSNIHRVLPVNAQNGWNLWMCCAWALKRGSQFSFFACLVDLWVWKHKVGGYVGDDSVLSQLTRKLKFSLLLLRFQTVNREDKCT